jgi:soluble lytic murein transglycosylase
MRGIGFTLSRLPTARALLAGAAILAGAFTSAAHGQSSGSGNGSGTTTADSTRADDAVWAMPYEHPGAAGGHDGGAAGVVFPRPLRPADVVVMRQIFGFQSRGDIPAAIRASADLDDPLLLGNVLAERYLGRHHRSSADELTSWLEHYRDLPDAPAIHALLLSKLARGAAAPPAPQTTAWTRPAEPDPVREDNDAGRNDAGRNDLARRPVPDRIALDRTVLDRAQRGDTASALRLISSTRGIDQAYAARLRAEVAQVAFTRNDDVDAFSIAQAALRNVAPENQPGLAFYIGGLAAWRLDRIELARTLFEGGAKASSASAHLRAASAFWASRASRNMHDASATVKWLRVAAEQRLTFHGLLARRILRIDTGIPPSGEMLSQADVDAVASTPNGRRAFGLLQVGQTARADIELRGLGAEASANPAFGRSLLIVATAAGLTDCAAFMASMQRPADGPGGETVRLPVPRLRPAGGFSIDPTLVYAVARTESNFDSAAISPAGARGLMQIMPLTAKFIVGDLSYDPGRLHDPSANLEIGQRYISHLASQEGIDNDLIRLLAGYNSGGGSIRRWSADIRDNGDPLLFIEAIPIAETRDFVARVLLYSWLYAARLHLPAASLDAMAANEFPRFTPPTAGSKMALLTPG